MYKPFFVRIFVILNLCSFSSAHANAEVIATPFFGVKQVNGENLDQGLIFKQDSKLFWFELCDFGHQDTDLVTFNCEQVGSKMLKNDENMQLFDNYLATSIDKQFNNFPDVALSAVITLGIGTLATWVVGSMSINSVSGEARRKMIQQNNRRAGVVGLATLALAGYVGHRSFQRAKKDQKLMVDTLQTHNVAAVSSTVRLQAMEKKILFFSIYDQETDNLNDKQTRRTLDQLLQIFINAIEAASKRMNLA